MCRSHVSTGPRPISVISLMGQIVVACNLSSLYFLHFTVFVFFRARATVNPDCRKLREPCYKVARVSKLLANRTSSHRDVILCASHIVCVCGCARPTVAISGCVLLPYSRQVYMYTVSRVYKGGCTRMCGFSLGPRKDCRRS